LDSANKKEWSAMLVLTRKARQAVVIGAVTGGDPLVIVRVLEIKGHDVRLGFEAGPATAVHRWEVWERIRKGPAGDLTKLAR
jgi:carbon storage regulator CsrA